jgi:hypothetical protein
MRWKDINEDAPTVPPMIEGVPREIVEACYAGLDDLKHSRGVPGEVVLAQLDQMLAEWDNESNGENRSSSPTTDQ